MMAQIRRIPEHGYLIDGQICYRATASALMERFNLDKIKNQDGNYYTLVEINEAIIGTS